MSDCHCGADDETRAHYPHEPYYYYYFYLLIISHDPHHRACFENHNDNDDIHNTYNYYYIHHIIIIRGPPRTVSACACSQSARGVTVLGRWEQRLRLSRLQPVDPNGLHNNILYYYNYYYIFYPGEPEPRMIITLVLSAERYYVKRSNRRRYRKPNSGETLTRSYFEQSEVSTRRAKCNL